MRNNNSPFPVLTQFAVKKQLTDKKPGHFIVYQKEKDGPIFVSYIAANKLGETQSKRKNAPIKMAKTLLPTTEKERIKTFFISQETYTQYFDSKNPQQKTALADYLKKNLLTVVAFDFDQTLTKKHLWHEAIESYIRDKYSVYKEGINKEEIVTALDEYYETNREKNLDIKSVQDNQRNPEEIKATIEELKKLGYFTCIATNNYKETVEYHIEKWLGFPKTPIHGRREIIEKKQGKELIFYNLLKSFQEDSPVKKNKDGESELILENKDDLNKPIDAPCFILLDDDDKHSALICKIGGIEFIPVRKFPYDRDISHLEKLNKRLSLNLDFSKAQESCSQKTLKEKKRPSGKGDNIAYLSTQSSPTMFHDSKPQKNLRKQTFSKKEGSLSKSSGYTSSSSSHTSFSSGYTSSDDSDGETQPRHSSPSTT